MKQWHLHLRQERTSGDGPNLPKTIFAWSFEVLGFSCVDYTLSDTIEVVKAFLKCFVNIGFQIFPPPWLGHTIWLMTIFVLPA